jgi:hypothetical protein
MALNVVRSYGAGPYLARACVQWPPVPKPRSGMLESDGQLRALCFLPWLESVRNILLGRQRNSLLASCMRSEPLLPSSVPVPGADKVTAINVDVQAELIRITTVRRCKQLQFHSVARILRIVFLHFNHQ